MNGSQSKGFEELVAQLARCYVPSDAEFIRKGSPDAGVECYAVIQPDCSEWAWQAKYFSLLDTDQWKQIDESVNTAIDKHPKLARYIICTPLDRSDSRVTGRKSALQKWNDLVKKWRESAIALGREISFEYWGGSEILDQLSKPGLRGKQSFWFGSISLDDNWLSQRLDEAIKTAGPRYTPEIHLDLPISQEFEGFGRTQVHSDQIRARARKLRSVSRIFSYGLHKLPEGTASELAASLSQACDSILKALGNLSLKPLGPPPFDSIAQLARAAFSTAENLARALSDLERETVASQALRVTIRESSSDNRDPHSDTQYALRNLVDELDDLRFDLEEAHRISGSQVMFIRGDAGTGKTHLLCDLASRRLKERAPTILLMGERFHGSRAPWSQALEQLDLASSNAEEFVGALESSAQAENKRALLIIDAINEGEGKKLWSTELPAFLTLLTRSPWIGVIVSVRSSYFKHIVPDALAEASIQRDHDGFAGHEYDATRAYFAYYEIELPSRPMLGAGFQNPLFLKLLCEGLSKKGIKRVPRGMSGITAVFEFYFNAINEDLASELDYNPADNLPTRAVEEYCRAVSESGGRWLSLGQTSEIVNALLPGRTHSKSLLAGLFDEGVFTRHAIHRGAEDRSGFEEYVTFAYEKLADHRIVGRLLDDSRVIDAPQKAFQAGGALYYLVNEEEYVSPGVLEALCIQIPERFGCEVLSLAPSMRRHAGFADAFRQSVIWRAPSAVRDDTRRALYRTCRSEEDITETVDTLITVASVPEHALNANCLDRILRRYSMPGRDAWWTVSLSRLHGSRGALERLVDWAQESSPEMVLDEEAVELCAMALAWSLTSSNRNLRDRATKGIVSLLTGRLGIASRILDRFADVDDPYVVERVYAVAYGLAMRSTNALEVQGLADIAYSRIFSDGRPTPHILLRDYARGVVERAVSLNSALPYDAELFRPLYKSKWPKIPSEIEIGPLLPDWTDVSHRGGQVEWSRNIIGTSVMEDGDFARYVIGTNWGRSDWLSIRITEPDWKSPSEQMESFCEGLTDAQRDVWSEFEKAEEELKFLERMQQLGQIERLTVLRPASPSESQEHERDSQSSSLVESSAGASPSVEALEVARARRLAAQVGLESKLCAEQKVRFQEILEISRRHGGQSLPPSFDLSVVQRFILWRVFDLGWTTQRFGTFDRFDVDGNRASARGAERIGMKYQWIALHEMLAYISDHYRFRGESGMSDVDVDYEGTWQTGDRDIDPSCTVESAKSGTPFDAHRESWWSGECYSNWNEPADGTEWASWSNDLPKVSPLLRVVDPSGGAQWVNVNGDFKWLQPVPVDRERFEGEWREMWFKCEGYLVPADDVNVFLKWGRESDFWEVRSPDAPELHNLFVGEHGWSPASRYFEQPYYGDVGWSNFDDRCPTRVKAMTVLLTQGIGGRDYSVKDGFSIRLPSRSVLNGMQLRWSGCDADYIDGAGQVCSFDPTIRTAGPKACLIRESSLVEYLVFRRFWP